MASSNSHRRNRPTDDGLVGDFVIGGEIGKGSFAQVFLGKHKVSRCALVSFPRPSQRPAPDIVFGDLCSS